MPGSKLCTQGSKKCCLVLLGKLLVICPGKSWMSLIVCDGPNWFGHYIKPKPYDSFTAEVIISSMFCSVLMWTGNLMVISHVEAVGRQQQPAIQPCTNSTVNFLGNPRGGTCEAPVIHLMRSIKLTPSMPEVKKKITAQESMHTTSNSMCNKAGIDKLDLHICVCVWAVGKLINLLSHSPWWENFLSYPCGIIKG